MNPVLALALLLAAGLAATHLSLPRLRHHLSLHLGVAGGALLVLAGLLLGPGIGVLDPTALRALAPVTALAIGWIGAGFGAHLEWRFVRRIPRRVWGLAALQAGVILLVTVLTAWLLARAVPALATAWRPRLPALLTLAAAAIVSAPTAVALVARTVGVRRSLARAFARAAVLDTALGGLVFALALALYHPRQPYAGGGVALAWAYWVAIAVTSSGGVGVLFLWLSRLRTDTSALGLDLLGVILCGSGLGYAAEVSPFVVCALATALIVNLSPYRRRVQALLATWDPPIYALFLILAGALVDLPTAWLLPAALLLAVIRVATRWVAVRYLRPSVGLATVAQGGVALAIALSFTLIYSGSSARGERGGSVFTTVLIAVALAQVFAARAMALALRPAPIEVR